MAFYADKLWLIANYLVSATKFLHKAISLGPKMHQTVTYVLQGQFSVLLIHSKNYGHFWGEKTLIKVMNLCNLQHWNLISNQDVFFSHICFMHKGKLSL